MNVIKFGPKEKMNMTIRQRQEKYIYKGYKAICIDGGEMRELVDLRIGATNDVCYASVWVKVPDCWACGTGKAGGYGYHKGSAAAAEAFYNAGMQFDEEVPGAGNGAILDAVQAAGERVSNGLPVYVVEFCG